MCRTVDDINQEFCVESNNFFYLKKKYSYQVQLSPASIFSTRARRRLNHLIYDDQFIFSRLIGVDLPPGLAPQ